MTEKLLNQSFNKPCSVGNEFCYIDKAIERGTTLETWGTSGCHTVIEQQLQVEKVLLANSCNHALEMAAMLLEIE